MFGIGKVAASKACFGYCSYSDATRISMLLQGVEQLQRLFPEVVQEDMASHGRYLLSVHGDYLRVRNYNMVSM